MNHELTDALKEKLVEVLTNELPTLRAKVGLSQQDLANKIGISRQAYGAIETRKQKMTWQNFITLILLFKNDTDTARQLYFCGAYPVELEQFLKLKNN
jgi:DNA-binding XRE family transcriptional regulator